MGNNALPAVADARVKAAVKKVHLSNYELSKFWLTFSKFDREGIGLISVKDFHLHILKEPQSFVSDAMLEFIETSSITNITFGEFVQVICLFSLFDKYDMLRFYFRILDKQNIGTLEPMQFKASIDELHGGMLKSNAELGFAEVAKLPTVDGRIGFREVAILHRRYPHIMYPVFRLQICLQRVSLGEKWWENRMIILSEEARILRKREQKKLTLKQNKVFPENDYKARMDERVKEIMGWWNYNLKPWKRKRTERLVNRMNGTERVQCYMNEELNDDIFEDEYYDDGASVSSADKHLVLSIRR